MHPYRLHFGSHRFNGAEVQVAAVNEGSDGVQQGVAGGQVPGAGPCLDEGEPLPIAANGFIVRFHGSAMHHQRAALAVGAQAHVHPKDEAICSDFVQRLDQALAHAQEELLVGPSGGRSPRFAVAEDQVDVRGQVEFPPAQLAQRQHKQALRFCAGFSSGRTVPRPLPAFHHGKGGVDELVRHQRKSGNRLLQRGQPQQMPPDNPELPPIAHQPQTCAAGFACPQTRPPPSVQSPS